MNKVIESAKKSDAVVLTTYEAFRDFNDLEVFLEEASNEGVSVTFVPFGGEIS